MAVKNGNSHFEEKFYAKCIEKTCQSTTIVEVKI